MKTRRQIWYAKRKAFITSAADTLGGPVPSIVPYAAGKSLLCALCVLRGAVLFYYGAYFFASDCPGRSNINSLKF
jgi:hypothetical protein